MHPSGSLVTVIFFFQACGALASNRNLIIKLNHGGSLEGIELKTETGRSFLGIPYAKAPVGELRFKSPVPYPGWEGQRSATEDGSSCTQAFALLADEGNEDCLFLNVYTPPLENITNSGLSVMVWYHGGAWFAGSNNHLFYGPEYILDHDIILITVNYRLGALGFLSSETLDCPGNFGLKDQVEALRWVKEHISSFGGNPNDVTIFGESAGGAS
uniref:Carboxylic ester hydrolase n=1 Tax=Megaselia scalaris TaxID=36166 RepID=T1H0G8_MEGSC